MAKPVIGGDGIGKPAHLFGFNLTDNEWKAALIDDDGALVTSGAAAAEAFEHGYGVGSASIGPATTANITVTLLGNLTATPNVVVGSLYMATADLPSSIHWYVLSYSQTTVVVRVRNNTDSTYTFYAHVIALRLA